MSTWLKEGKVKYKEDVTDGLENAPRELIGLLRGENFGKKIIRISPALRVSGHSQSILSSPPSDLAS